MSRPTPETDAAWKEGNAIREWTCRKLERERDELRENTPWHSNGETKDEWFARQREKYVAIERERDEAREELAILRSNKMSDPLLETTFKHLIRERDEAREAWGQASMDAAQLLSEKTKVIAERDELREEVASLRLEAKYHDEADALRKCRERERDEARSLTEHQWLLKVGSRLVAAGCKSDGILDSIDEIIRERDEARKEIETLRSHYADKSKEACDLAFENRSLRIALQEIESIAKKKLDQLETF